MTDESRDDDAPYFSWQALRRWPRSLRLAAGVLLVIGGIFGILPVLGFWMIPLGLAVLSIDLPIVRRLWRRLRVWWVRRVLGNDKRRPPAAKTNGDPPTP